MNKFKAYLITILNCLMFPFLWSLHVAEFGAFPDDGKCDMNAINAALVAAKKNNKPVIYFDAGTYNLRNTCIVPGKGYENYITLHKFKNFTIEGATDKNGKPATRIERNLKLSNDTEAPHQVDISYSKGITLRNLILTNDPPLGTTAKVIEVDKVGDSVTVEILDGLPCYDGMRCASAHAWNLEEGTLKRFGTTPSGATLTIGLNVKAFWEKIPGTEKSLYSLRGAGFAKKLDVGDGLSWHHKSSEMHNQVQIMRSEDIILENIIMPNVSNAGILAGYNHNVTIRKVCFEPENGNLAVGGRDGIHLSNTSGVVLVEDCYFKGLRMDPLVFRKTFGVIQEIGDDSTIVSKPGFTIPVGSKIRFWVGDEPEELEVTGRKALGNGNFWYSFKEPIPKGTKESSVISFQAYSIDSGVVRNCVFEGNFGSAIVNFIENLIVENCVFKDNSYQIKYGANYLSGAFVRNNVFRNNIIEDVSWIDIARRGQPSALMIHSLSRLFDNPKYNQHIKITGNIFRNPHGLKNSAAIHVLNATDVQIYNNTYEGYEQEVLVDNKSTKNITLEEK